MLANGNKAVTCYLLMKRSNEQWLLSDWLFQATECWPTLLMCVIVYLCDPVRAKYPITWIMATPFSVLIHTHNCFTATIQVNWCHLVTPVKNWRILLEQSFTICMSLWQQLVFSINKKKEFRDRTVWNGLFGKGWAMPYSTSWVQNIYWSSFYFRGTKPPKMNGDLALMILNQHKVASSPLLLEMSDADCYY